MWKTKSRLGSFWLQLSHTPPREPPAKVGWWWGGRGRKGRLEMSNEGRIFYLFRFAPTPPRHSRRLVFFRLLHYSPFLVMPSCPLFTLVETSWEKRRRTDTQKKWAAAELTWIHLTRFLSLALPASSSHRIWVKASFFYAVYTRKALSHNTLSWMFNNILFYSFYLENVYLVCEGSWTLNSYTHTHTLSRRRSGSIKLNWTVFSPSLHRPERFAVAFLVHVVCHVVSSSSHCRCSAWFAFFILFFHFALAPNDVRVQLTFLFALFTQSEVCLMVESALTCLFDYSLNGAREGRWGDDEVK